MAARHNQPDERHLRRMAALSHPSMQKDRPSQGVIAFQGAVRHARPNLGAVRARFRRERRMDIVPAMRPKLAVDRERLAVFCRKHGIRRLAFFGSVLREDFGPRSDVDVLVEFEPGRTPGFFGQFDMEDELSPLIEGRKVDLRTPDDLSPYFRSEVLRTAALLYDAA